MKIYKRLRHHITDAGLLTTFLFLLNKNARTYLKDYFFDWIHGVDFCQRVSREEMDRVISDSTYYSYSDKRAIKELFNTFSIKQNDNFIDIGCGKGLIIYALSTLPFSKIDGVEYSPQLAEIARQNIQKLGINKASIYNTDASQFENYANYNYYYMYNPFGEITMRSVISKIENSLIHNKRIIYVIYGNPVCHNIIIKNQIFKLVKIHGQRVDSGGNKLYIYSNNS